ncbi:hypothetical protein [Collimonas humicola]|uniref:hypothetical protein n=1 Tax=Collimonas humicola TaxID=2825886 RepID=UPI001B8CD751|nr:hypothetical protein [Collimonas humicola]
MLPTASQLIIFCDSIIGKPLVTQLRNKVFSVDVVAGSYYLVVGSSGQRRKIDSNEKITQLIALLANTGSQRPTKYRDITFNASYLLELIRQWQIRASEGG